MPDALAESFHHQLLDVVLPWWVRNGVDDQRGGVYTCFSNDGKLLSKEKYTWSQGRWAWLCARISDAASRGIVPLDAQEWSARAAGTAEFLYNHALVGIGVTAFRTDANGIPVSTADDGEADTSVLSDLFAALGFAAVAGLDGASAADQRKWSTAASQILIRAEEMLARRTASTEPYPVPPGYANGGSLMMLMHVGTELYRFSGSEAARDTALRAAQRLIGGTRPLWTASGWWELRPDSDGDEDTLFSRHLNPGHLLEALWMIEETADLIPTLRGELPKWVPDLASMALGLGWDGEHGGMLRFVDRTGGEPHGRVEFPDRYAQLVATTWDTKLWWVHVEALYATRELYDRYGHTGLAGWYERIARYTLDTFPDPAGKEWIQIRSRVGEPLDMVVALPVKDPFHIARALLHLVELDQRALKGPDR